MIRWGRLQGPYTHVLASSQSNTSLDGDFSFEQKTNMRKNGIFMLKIFSNLPFDEKNPLYLGVKRVTIDNGIINYDPNFDKCQIVTPTEILTEYCKEDVKCETIEEYMKCCLGPNYAKYFHYSDEEGVITCKLKTEEVLVLSDRAQKVLGASTITYSGPTEAKFSLFPDLYVDMKPLLITCENVETSFVNESLKNLLTSVDLSNELDNVKQTKTRSFTKNFREVEYRKLARPMTQYIKLEVTNINGKKISFLPTAEITIHLIIRTSPFELL